MSIFLQSLMHHKKHAENFNHKEQDIRFQQDNILLPDTLNQLVSESFTVKNFNHKEHDINFQQDNILLPDTLNQLVSESFTVKNFNHKEQGISFQQDNILLPDTLNQLVSESFNNFENQENIIKKELILPYAPEVFGCKTENTKDSDLNNFNEIRIDEEKDLTKLSKVELSRALVELIVRNSEFPVHTPPKKRKAGNAFTEGHPPLTSSIDNALPTSRIVKQCRLNINSKKETLALSSVTLDNLSKTKENQNQCEINFTTADNSEKASSKKIKTFYYFCNSCNLQQSEKNVIIRHIEKEHPRMLETNSGNKEAFTTVSVIKHENVEKWLKLYCCNCNKNYQHNTFHRVERLCCDQQMLYKCGKCGILYKCRNKIYSHIHKICLPDYNFQCQSCNYITFKKENFQWHHWKEHLCNDIRIKYKRKWLGQYCNKCHIIYESMECVDAINTCLKCGGELLSKNCIQHESCPSDRSHVLPYNMWPTIYCCNFCNYTTKNQTYLQFHVWINHGNGDQSYNEPKMAEYFRTFCFHCNRICGPMALEPKCRLCNQQTLYTCCSPSCDVGYSRKASLYAHVTNKHLTGRSCQCCI